MAHNDSYCLRLVRNFLTSDNYLFLSRQTPYATLMLCVTACVSPPIALQAYLMDDNQTECLRLVESR
jgi:hypothetical protein